METISLVDKVKIYLKEKHQILYCKGLEYNVDGTFHELKWELNNTAYPFIMMGDFLSEDDFFNYICKDIDKRRLFLTKYFVLKMETSETNDNCKNNNN